MASEGVLSYDEKRYGFGHETFFDYCFARGFVAQEDSLTAFLINSEQHLFRRAQVRQVLVYLRDANRERYCTELRTLLEKDDIRYHLKALACALAVEMPDPQKKRSGKCLLRGSNPKSKQLRTVYRTTDKFASLVWNRFFFSQPWFQVADKKGLIAHWLSI